MKKLYIIGAHRVGKTYLCEQLAAQDPEIHFARTGLKRVFKPIWEEVKGALREGDRKRFYALVVELQRKLARTVVEDSESIPPGANKVVLDRAIVDVLAYSTNYLETCAGFVGTLGLTFEHIEEFNAMVWMEIVPMLDKDAKYLLVQPGIEFIPVEGSHDEATQQKTSDNMIKWASRLLPPENLVIIPTRTTNLKDRMAYATELLN